MKRFAFKRAKSSHMSKDSLHPEFIVEFADISLFPEGFHKAEDGYEFLDEDDFNLEYAKNQDRHDEFLAKKKEEEALKIKEKEALEIQRLAKEKQEQRELEQFRKWKLNKGK